MKNRLSVKEIAERLDIGKMSVYAMLESGTLAGIRVGKRLLVTRYAYEQSEHTGGMSASSPGNAIKQLASLGFAALASMFNLGFAMSQARGQSILAYPSASQLAAEGGAREMSEFGAEIPIRTRR